MLLLVCGDIESCPGPALFRNASDFTILHQNVCGLASKKDILEDFILEKNIKISGVTETPLRNATPTFLVDIWSILLKHLKHLINLCLSTGKKPEAFKIGKITPLFKNRSKHQFNNYRPITVLPIGSKVLERCINSQLMNHLETYKILSEY